jgi:hypothetical protein
MTLGSPAMNAIKLFLQVLIGLIAFNVTTLHSVNDAIEKTLSICTSLRELK